MECLGIAANVIAVASIAIQLADSIQKLCEFWRSIKEAPEEIRTIITDLELISGVLADIALEKHVQPDATTVAVLERCTYKVERLTTIARDFEPGFVLKRLPVRKWTAFKVVIKAKKLNGFREALDGLKVTLILAQQSHFSRINRLRHETQQQELKAIMQRVNDLRSKQAS